MPKPTIQYILVLCQVNENGSIDPIKKSLPVAFSDNPIIGDKAFNAFKSSEQSSIINDQLIPTKEQLSQEDNFTSDYYNFFKTFNNKIENYNLKQIIKQSKPAIAEQSAFTLADMLED